MQYELIPATVQDRQVAFLAFAGIVGGGIIAYEAGRAIRDGDLFAVDPHEQSPKAGALGTVAGVAFFALMVKEAVKEVGWKPLLLGSTAVAAFPALGHVTRR